MTTGQTLLLTGADGFTGRHMEAAALALGYRVHRLAANLLDAIDVTREVAAVVPDCVIHLAAISAVTHADELALYRVNVFGTQHLLDALASTARAPSVVLIASSANVYGNCTDSPISERQLPEPVNHYALSKLAAEGVARMFLQRLPITVIRPFNYTGVGHDLRFVIPKIVQAYQRRDPAISLGNVLVEREYNDVRFVVDVYMQLLLAAQGAASGTTYNLCSGIAHSLQQVLKIMNEITGYAPDVRVNQALLRANEVQRLCGSTEKLHSVASPRVKNDMRALLTWMLDNDAAPPPSVMQAA